MDRPRTTSKARQAGALVGPIGAGVAGGISAFAGIGDAALIVTVIIVAITAGVTYLFTSEAWQDLVARLWIRNR